MYFSPVILGFATLVAAAPLPNTLTTHFHSRQAAAAPAQAPTTTAILNSLNSVSTSIDGFTGAANAFTKGAADFLPVAAAEGSLTTNIQVATSAVSASPPLSEADNAVVALQISQILPKVGAAAKVVSSKQKAIHRAKLDSDVEAAVGQLESSVSGLGAAMIRIVTPPTVQPVLSATNGLLQVLQEVGQVFG